MKHSLKLGITGLISVAFLSACGPDAQMQDESALAMPADSDLGQTESELSVSGYTYTLTPRGGWSGNPYTLSCNPGYVAAGIYGRSGGYVDQLGLECAYMNMDGSLGFRYRTGTAGGTGGGYFSISCPTGQAIVGFQGRVGNLVDRLGIYCAYAADWRINGVVQYVSYEVGGTGGGPFSDVCPGSYMLTALNVRADRYVVQEQGICSYINP